MPHEVHEDAAHVVRPQDDDEKVGSATAAAIAQIHILAVADVTVGSDD